MKDALRLVSPAWAMIETELAGRTTLVVGAPGNGKSRFCVILATSLSQDGQQVAILSTDPGQPLVGVPGCLGLTLSAPWDRADALWFVGDTSPMGHLLPVAIGAGALARHARDRGVATLLVDTSGMIGGGQARVLDYHQLVAVGATQMVAIGRDPEVEHLARLAETVGLRVFRLDPVSAAHDRSLDQRRLWRQARYEDHFRGASTIEIPRARVLGPDWIPLDEDPPSRDPAPGTVLGFLGPDRVCLGLGLLQDAGPGSLRALTHVTDLTRVRAVLAGRLRLDPAHDFEEIGRRPSAPP